MFPSLHLVLLSGVRLLHVLIVSMTEVVLLWTLQFIDIAASLSRNFVLYQHAINICAWLWLPHLNDNDCCIVKAFKRIDMT